MKMTTALFLQLGEQGPGEIVEFAQLNQAMSSIGKL